jgi:hypothetical protein
LPRRFVHRSPHGHVIISAFLLPRPIQSLIHFPCFSSNTAVKSKKIQSDMREPDRQHLRAECHVLHPSPAPPWQPETLMSIASDHSELDEPVDCSTFGLCGVRSSIDGDNAKGFFSLDTTRGPRGAHGPRRGIGHVPRVPVGCWNVRSSCGSFWSARRKWFVWECKEEVIRVDGLWMEGWESSVMKLGR